MSSTKARINSSFGSESSALHERELRLSKSKIRIRFASDKKALREEDDFLERLKNFGKFREKVNRTESVDS